MLPCLSCTAIFASSTSIWTNCSSSREVRVDHLERDELLEAGDALGLREVDLGHAADRDLADEPIRAELRAQPPVGWPALARLRGVARLAVSMLRRAAGMDEHADQAQRRLRAAVERAHDLGRHAVRDVDDVARGRVGDEVEAEAGAVGLAIDLLRRVQALVDVREDRVLREPAEAIAHRDREHARRSPRSGSTPAAASACRVRSCGSTSAKIGLPSLVDRRVVERVHQQLFAHLADRGAHLAAHLRASRRSRARSSIAVLRPSKSRSRA